MLDSFPQGEDENEGTEDTYQGERKTPLLVEYFVKDREAATYVADMIFSTIIAAREEEPEEAEDENQSTKTLPSEMEVFDTLRTRLLTKKMSMKGVTVDDAEDGRVGLEIGEFPELDIVVPLYFLTQGTLPDPPSTLARILSVAGKVMKKVLWPFGNGKMAS